MIFRRKITSAKIEKICWQITLAAWMQPFQCDLRCSTAKDNSITHAAAAPSNLDAATTMRSAETELQNTIELRATESQIAAPKPDLEAKAEKKNNFETFFTMMFKRKITNAKIEKICGQITVAAWMQPFQYDLRSSAAKDNSITSNLDAAITLRFAASRSKVLTWLSLWLGHTLILLNWVLSTFSPWTSFFLVGQPWLSWLAQHWLAKWL